MPFATSARRDSRRPARAFTRVDPTQSDRLAAGKSADNNLAILPLAQQSESGRAAPDGRMRIRSRASAVQAVSVRLLGTDGSIHHNCRDHHT